MRGETVYYVTERCVSKLIEEGLEIVELAPGVALGRDTTSQMAFRTVIPDNIRSYGRPDLLGREDGPQRRARP